MDAFKNSKLIQFFNLQDQISKSNLSEEKKTEKFKELLDKLTDEEKNLLLSHIRSEKILSTTKRPCHKKDKNKIAIVEISNISRDFDQQLMHLGNIWYVWENFRRFEGTPKEKEIIRDFINGMFGVQEDHVGAIIDLRADHIGKDELVKVPEPLYSEIKTSHEKVQNSFQFIDQHYDELLLATNIYFGTRPNHESMICVQGVFNKNEKDKYIEKHKKELLGTMYYEIPIGEIVLTDPLKEVLGNTTMESSIHPSLNSILNSKKHQNRANTNNLMMRIARDKSKEVDPEVQNQMYELRKELNKLNQTNMNDFEQNKIDEMISMKDELEGKIHQLALDNTEENEVLTELIDPATKTKKMVRLTKEEHEILTGKRD